MGRGSGGREWLAISPGPEAGGFTKKLFFLQLFKVFARFGGNEGPQKGAKTLKIKEFEVLGSHKVPKPYVYHYFFDQGAKTLRLPQLFSHLGAKTPKIKEFQVLGPQTRKKAVFSAVAAANKSL